MRVLRLLIESRARVLRCIATSYRQIQTLTTDNEAETDPGVGSPAGGYKVGNPGLSTRCDAHFYHVTEYGSFRHEQFILAGFEKSLEWSDQA